jgi:hypothetical protein
MKVRQAVTLESSKKALGLKKSTKVKLTVPLKLSKDAKSQLRAARLEAARTAAKAQYIRLG